MRKFSLLAGALMMLLFVFLLSTCKKNNSESCVDGIKNQDETDIDCGGTCPACTVACSPTAPAGLNVTNFTVSSVSLSWTAVAGAVSYNVQYRQVGSTSWIAGPSPSTNSCTIIGLTPSTNYQWQVKTNCASGSSAYSSNSSFSTTLSGSNCGSPTGLTVSGVDTNKATLNWTAVSGASSYGVSYRKAGTSSWPAPVTHFSTSYSISSGLLTGTSYEWRVSALCASGTSANSNSTFSTSFPPSCTVPAACKNGLKDGAETGTDCGGGSCNACPAAASGQIIAIVDGCSWTATHSNIMMASFFNFQCSSTNGDSLYMGFTGVPNLGSQRLLSTSSATILGVQYSGSNSGYITITDTSNSVMSGTFRFSGVDASSITKHVSSGSFKDVPFHH